MSAEERLRKARERLAQAGREQQERSVLRNQKLAETEKNTKAAFQKRIDAAVKYADHMAELQERQEKAGGWATENALSDRNNNQVMTFGPEIEDETASSEQGTHHQSPSPTPVPRNTPSRRPSRSSPHEEIFDDEDLSNTSWLR